MSKASDNLWLNLNSVNSNKTDVKDGLSIGLEQHASSDFGREMLI